MKPNEVFGIIKQTNTYTTYSSAYTLQETTAFKKYAYALLDRINAERKADLTFIAIKQPNTTSTYNGGYTSSCTTRQVSPCEITTQEVVGSLDSLTIIEDIQQKTSYLLISENKSKNKNSLFDTPPKVVVLANIPSINKQKIRALLDKSKQSLKGVSINFLIQYCIENIIESKKCTLIEAIKEISPIFGDAFALAAIHVKKYPEKIILARKGMPLSIKYHTGSQILAFSNNSSLLTEAYMISKSHMDKRKMTLMDWRALPLHDNHYVTLNCTQTSTYWIEDVNPVRL